MTEIKIPIKIDGFQCIEEMVQTVLNYTYKGRTLKEWADSISEPQTNADRIRAMTDKELAEYLCRVENADSYAFDWLYWLKQEVKE